MLDNPWSKIEDKFKIDEVCAGKITNIVQNGVYIEISDSIEGFLHNNDISWTRRIKTPVNLFNVGEEIKVKILLEDMSVPLFVESSISELNLMEK